MAYMHYSIYAIARKNAVQWVRLEIIRFEWIMYRAIQACLYGCGMWGNVWQASIGHGHDSFIAKWWIAWMVMENHLGLNFYQKHDNTYTYTTVLQLCRFCPGQPGSGDTRRTIHPLTPITVISCPLSVSSIYYDPFFYNLLPLFFGFSWL